MNRIFFNQVNPSILRIMVLTTAVLANFCSKRLIDRLGQVVRSFAISKDTIFKIDLYYKAILGEKYKILKFRLRF